MKINVIVPAVQPDFCDDMLESLGRNTVLPTRVVLIDNTIDRNYRPHSDFFKIDRYESRTGKVNESWNLGVSLVDVDADYVSILNDDIYLNQWFYQRVLETFGSRKDCGVACPKAVNRMEELGKGKGRPRITKMSRREGFAFTFAKKVLDFIAPIPAHRVEIFHGDDWFWHWTKMRGFFWYQDLGNIIFHHVGGAVKLFGYRKVKKKERNEWHRVMADLK